MAALLFTVVAAVYYGPYLHALPTAIHSWAQSDRLALAVNFYDYGFHFFTPRTSSLVSIGGVTGVEFPIQPYLAALGGVILGRDNIVFVFRLLDVVMTVVCFYYLFRLVYEHTGNFVAGLVPGAFLLASPFFAFYAGSFMPDTFSLALSFIAYYYWLRFFDKRHFPDLARTLVVLTLAGLIKTTTALHLGAVVCITILWAYLQPELLQAKQRWQLLIGIGISFSLIIAFYLHNQSLNEHYRSWQFLATTNPIQSAEMFHDVLQSVRNTWLGEYATRTQYRVLLVCALLLLPFLRANVSRYLPFSLLLAASIVIAGIFVQLMGAQLAVHDYYLICSFVPPALLLLLLAVLNLGRYTGPVRYVVNLGLSILIISLVASGHKRFNRRMSDDYLPFSQYYTNQWMRGGAEEMKQARVPENAAILLINEAVNTGLVYFDRRGLTWQPNNPEALTAADFLNRMAIDSLDYLVLPPTLYKQLAPQHGALAEAFETVGQTPAVILKRRDRERTW